jgi:hypothetical protein
MSYKQNSLDIPQAMPINLNTPSINATFMLDSEHRVLSFFHSWMQEIINYNAMNGLLSAVNGDHMPFEIGYKDDYSCILNIVHYKTNATGDNIEEGYEYRFEDVYPTEIGGQTLSWAASDSFATMTVNFTASKYSFTAAQPGQLLSSNSRGNGYLDFFNSVGFRGQTTQQRNLPRSVQDAINTFTTVRNDFRTLRNTFNSFRNLF